MRSINAIAANEVKQMAKSWRYFKRLLDGGELPAYGFYPLEMAYEEGTYFFDLENPIEGGRDRLKRGFVVASIRNSVMRHNSIVFELIIDGFLALRVECGGSK